MDHPAIYLSAFFIGELILLYFFSRLLTIAFSTVIHSLTHSRNSAITVIAVFFLPGTLIHELAHALSAGVMMVHVGAITVFPQIQEDHVKLGSVEIAKTDPIRRSLIGVAPVLVGLGLIIGTLYYLTFKTSLSELPIWGWLVLFYLILVISNTMFSSKKDLEGTLGMLFILIAFILAFYITGFTLPFTLLGQLFTEKVLDTFLKINLILLVPIVIDLLIFLMVKLLIHKRY